MINRPKKVFIDSNMIIFAADFRKENVFEWMSKLYEEIYIHSEVYNEILILETQKKVDTLINSGEWKLFDPNNSPFLSDLEKTIYAERLKDVMNAFRRMNEQRIKDGKTIKTVSNIGEMATIAACLLMDAGIICSNDFDIKTVIEQENYRVTIENDDFLIIQDSAEDFCFYCFQAQIASRKSIRSFFKSIILEDKNRDMKLTQLNSRLQKN